jgi:hypothetical protein
MFTSEDALDLKGTPDAIMLNWRATAKVLLQHGIGADEGYRDMIADGYINSETPLNDLRLDAGDLFAFLGY